MKTNTEVTKIAKKVEEIKTELTKAQTKFAVIEKTIKTRANNIDALTNTRRKLSPQEEVNLDDLLNNQADEKNDLIDLKTDIQKLKIELFFFL